MADEIRLTVERHRVDGVAFTFLQVMRPQHVTETLRQFELNRVFTLI